MRNPFRAYKHAPAFLKLASIYAIVMAILIYGGCPKPPTPINTNNSNDNGSSNVNTNSTSNQNGSSIENLNGSTGNSNSTANDNGGDDVDGDPTKPIPARIDFEEIVESGDPVPGNSGATFARPSQRDGALGSPIIDASGRVAFWAYHTGGSGHGGLYVWEPGESGAPGTIRTVIDDSGSIAVPAAAPGETTDEAFFCNPATLDIRSQPLTWSSDGRLLFVSGYSGTGNQLVLRWSAEDGSLLRVADAQSISDVLGTSATATWLTFSNLGRSDDGAVFFEVNFQDISASPFLTGQAICKAEVIKPTGSAGKILITLVVPYATAKPPDSAKGKVPDQDGYPEAAFVIYDPPTTLSPAGYVLFQGGYDGGTGSHGLYVYTPGGDVVRGIDNRPDYSWPGLDPDAVVGNSDDFYDATAISTNDHIAVQTPIIVGGSSSRHVILWDFDIMEWTELETDDGQAITDLLSGVSDGGAVLGLAGSDPYIVSIDKSASIEAGLPTELTGVSLEWYGWGETSGSINNSGHAVIPYVRSLDSTDGLGFWNNQELLILADPQLNIPAENIIAITADSSPVTDRPGRSGILNDADEAVFRVDFGTDVQAIYVGRAQPAQ